MSKLSENIKKSALLTLIITVLCMLVLLGIGIPAILIREVSLWFILLYPLELFVILLLDEYAK